MADTLPPAERSRVMSKVRSTDTGPEMIVRRLAHSMGFRYRLHDRNLPGTPDLVFRKRGKVVFVHGCFWHQHDGCPFARFPKSRQDFWRAKLGGNKARDKRQASELISRGWKVLVIWECETRDLPSVAARLRHFLDDEGTG